MTATTITVNINETMLGTDATCADARKMVELLNARGYDAHYSQNANRLSEDEQEQFDTDFAQCLELI